MNHGSLFNGIGGFQLAAHWMGWTNIMHCEIDDFCNKVVKQNFPNSICHGDIRNEDFTKYGGGAINILTGGEPCQPHSVAGKKKGKEDIRYLWPEYKRAIVEIQPEWVVNENVPGSISNGILDEKISDLEAIGYSWWPPFVIPASGVGAYHKRERVWLVSHHNCKRVERSSKEQILGQSDIQIGQIISPFQEAERRFHAFESRLCRTLHGLPNGTHRVKALGNAIVPQIAFEIFKAIEEHELMAR